MKYLYTKILNIVKRAFVSQSLTDDKSSGIVQVSYFGKTGVSEVISPYGLSVRLPTGIQVLLFAVQSQENNRACIGYSQKDRFKDLEEGEVVIGNPLTRSFIKFDIDGNIEIESTGKIDIKSAKDVTIDVTGTVDLKATGDVTVDSPKVNLGIGGPPIARLGDTVMVSGTPGTITSAGVNTSL